MTPDDLHRRIMSLAYTLIGLSLLCVFVLDWNKVGIVLALLVPVMGLLLRFAPFRHWLIRRIMDRGETPQKSPSAPEATLTEAEIEKLLAEEAIPAILLRRHWPPQDLAPQRSWLGGLPCLPGGVEWPVNQKTGFALHHLAQIDLEEMPVVEAPTGWPQSGTLWFFADIDEDMDWDSRPGMAEARVIYHPQSTAGLPMRPAPDTLPQVDHPDSGMESELWSFRPARFTVYPRWPVTGHATTTWPQDTLPKGQRWDSPYAKARDARMQEAVNAAKGPAPVLTRPKAGIYQPETRQTEDGEERPTGRTLYCPDVFGPRFPYHNALGGEVLHALRHGLRARLSRAEDTLCFVPKQITKAQDAGKDTSKMVARLDKAQDEAVQLQALIAPITALHDALTGRPEVAPLTADDQQAFDVFMGRVALGPETGRGGAKAVQRGLQRMLQRATDTPALARTLPPAFLNDVREDFLPTASTAQHFLLGAKGVASNATDGHGIRLAQFDSDYAMDFMFCDVGIIDFWIDPQDLAAGRWDRAWAATAGG